MDEARQAARDALDKAQQQPNDQNRQELSKKLEELRQAIERHMQAMRTIAARIGLDYFGVDCGLDTLGNLVVFEVNASILVHDEEDDLAYKNPFVRKIKTAFNTMLARLAGAGATAS